MPRTSRSKRGCGASVQLEHGCTSLVLSTLQGSSNGFFQVKRGGRGRPASLGGWRTVYGITRRTHCGLETAVHTPVWGVPNPICQCSTYSSDEEALVSMVAAYHTIKPKAVLLTTSAMLYKMFRASVLASSPVPRK